MTYSGEDIRYTRSKDGKTLYAAALGWPEGGAFVPGYVQVDNAEGGKVELIGHDRPLEFKVNADNDSDRDSEKAIGM